jgi:hypothetical protein
MVGGVRHDWDSFKFQTLTELQLNYKLLWYQQLLEGSALSYTIGKTSQSHAYQLIGRVLINHRVRLGFSIVMSGESC